jgi:uncharacterized membrane protein
LYAGQDLIQETASNSQRALMNIASLTNSFNNLITLDETAVFDVVSEYQYSHDSSNLTVHNLFLSFSLFNGLLPAIILLTVVMVGIRRLSGTSYLPIGVFVYFLMLLGPDSFETRYALLLLVALVVIGRYRLQPYWATKLPFRRNGN